MIRTIHRLRPTISTSRRHSSMLSWKVTDSLNDSHKADIKSKLKLVDVRQPTISSPWDVLVKVHSASVNPLDVRMVYGYGRKVLDLLDMVTNFEPKITNDRYPLTLGRDFSGEVVATGACARHLKPGNQVFGVSEPHKSGTHAQFITTPYYCLTKKPDKLSHQDASSIPFVALTAYAALRTFGQLPQNKCNGKQILVIGGSGGVGTFAIQLLKLWGANVTATCSEDKMTWLEEELMVDRAVSHNDRLQMESLNGGFDFVLDAGSYDNITQTRAEVVGNNLKLLKPMSQSVYVTLSPPILSNTDKEGIALGIAKTVVDAIEDVSKGLSNLNSARWALFLPNKSALDYVASLLDEEAIVPRVSHTFEFQKLPEAFECLQNGQAKGKVVVNLARSEPTDE